MDPWLLDFLPGPLGPFKGSSINSMNPAPTASVGGDGRGSAEEPARLPRQSGRHSSWSRGSQVGVGRAPKMGKALKETHVVI